MSREPRQRLREDAKREENRLAQRKKLSLILPVIGVPLIALGAFASIHFGFQKSNPATTPIATVQTPGIKQPGTLAQLLELSTNDLEKCDIARMNLLCAEGLPGAENLKVNDDLATLDSWAQHIKSEIDRNFHHYRDDPAYFYNSTNFYKMAMMGVVLYEDYNVRYNPALIETPSETTPPDDHFFDDSNDILIHGLIAGRHLGTCSSMPVLYVALGRRLGYPLKLVSTKGHLFVRWDSSSEKFDMDATSKGVSHEDDGVYRQWPFPISDQEIREEGYLKSLTPAEELSVFLSIRGMCQTEHELRGDAMASFSQAYRYEPAWKANQVLLTQARARLARPTILVQQQPPMNPKIPDVPNPIPQMPRNPFQTLPPQTP